MSTIIPQSGAERRTVFVATRRRQSFLFSGDPASAYVRALRSAGWTVTALSASGR